MGMGRKERRDYLKIIEGTLINKMVGREMSRMKEKGDKRKEVK